MHFDGDDWQALDLGLSLPILQWVHGRSPKDVTFVGTRGTIVHWNGSEATLQSSPTDAPLWGIWGATSDDLWAVGGGAFEGDEPVLLHFDGAEWTTVTVLSLTTADVRAFFKVWGSSANDVYVVGQRGVLLHFDGLTWTEMASGTTEDLISIWGTGPNRIVMVGGRSNGVAIVKDKAGVRALAVGNVPALNGVWLAKGTKAHAVGIRGTHIEIDLDAPGEARLVDTSTTKDLHGVFGTGNDLYAVGGNLFASSAPFRGVALLRNIRE